MAADICSRDECTRKVWFTAEGLCRVHGLQIGADWPTATTEASDDAAPDADGDASATEAHTTSAPAADDKTTKAKGRARGASADPAKEG